jgi:hypothetical protein
MSIRLVLSGLLAATFLSATAIAQTTRPADNPPAATTLAPKSQSKLWRASKLIGVNIYNEQNEKLGDINEILLDPSGKINGYVVGVGGFLGMGEHDILVEPAKIKFVNEPVRTTTAQPAPTGKQGDAPTNTRNVSSTGERPARAANEQWYPDHGVLSATKDQLKAMPQFKYSTYN